MNLHGLRLFYEVAKQKSVTQAAKKLAISQPAVTAQIKKFQEEENVMLLIPDGRGIQLTSIGQEVYQEAQKLFAIEKTIE
ncbi:LysR family transcriptional regulator, partial [Carnobacterium sp.]